jgi:hypothetical protein
MTSMFPEDPFGGVKKDKQNPNPTTKEVTDFHTKADTDGSPLSIHHTLGINRNQSSPGNHVHDGKASPKIGRGLGLTISGAKGGNAAVASIITMLKSVIEFTDNTTA